MAQEKYFWINDEWLTWEQAHYSFGYTKDKPNSIITYDLNLTEYTIYQDKSDLTYWNGSSWYTKFSDTGYWLKTNARDKLYLCEEQITFDRYKNITDTPELYSDNISYPLNEKLYTYNYLHDMFGYTKTKSEAYLVTEGIVQAWYNQDEEMYWDNRSGKKWWTAVPPTITHDVPPEVLPNPIPLVEIDSFSEMDPPISFSGLRPFTFHLESSNWTHGQLLKLIDIDTEFNNPLAVYKDVLDENLTLWVINPDGIDFQGEHYNYADSITPVDKFAVMVDPIGEESFYYRGVLYNFSYLYDSLSSTLKHYWKEDHSAYYTEEELLALGYTRTIQSKAFITNDSSQVQDIVEIWYNEAHGYYYDGVWYLTEQELNNAGYYLIEKIIQELYVGPYNWQTWYYNYGITKNSTSFRLTGNYVMNLWLDNERSQPFLYDGKNWKFDIEETAKYRIFSNPVPTLDQMPTSTTSTNNWYTLLSIITQSGNPISPLIQSDIGLQMRGHISTNYYAGLSTSTDFKIVISYWKHVDKALSFTNTQLPDIK